MNENQHAPCPFCGGTDLMMINYLRSERLAAFVECLNKKCKTTGPQRTADRATEAIAAAWEAWDAAGKKEDAK